MSKKFMDNVFRTLEMIYYSESPKKITKMLVKNMSDEQIARVLLFLENKGFLVIDHKDRMPFPVTLTDKGVEFFVGELSRKRQDEFNRMVAFSGAILALMGIYTFIKELGLINIENAGWINGLFLLAALACVGPLVEFIVKQYFGKN